MRKAEHKPVDVAEYNTHRRPGPTSARLTGEELFHDSDATAYEALEVSGAG